MLALSGMAQPRPWLVAGAITAAFWAVLWTDALIRQGAGGANIGLGLVMLLSPIIAYLGAVAAVKRDRS